jgi:hypothetical protein
MEKIESLTIITIALNRLYSSGIFLLHLEPIYQPGILDTYKYNSVLTVVTYQNIIVSCVTASLARHSNFSALL